MSPNTEGLLDAETESSLLDDGTDVTVESVVANGSGPANADVASAELASERRDVRAAVADPDTSARPEWFQPRNWTIENRWSQGLNWPIVVWITVVHLGLLAAPFYFTWKALGLAVFLYWLTGPIGVCMGYHRLLTHKSFTTSRAGRWLLALLGGLSGEGSAIAWVANHRKHHTYSDQPGDPHSPRDGSLWSHMLWFMPNLGNVYHSSLANRFAPDLVRDPVMRALHVLFLPLQIGLGLVLLGTGWYFWDFYTGMSLLVWGVFVRMVAVFHVTWFVNSATHIWGYRNYETTDDSKNLWWVAIFAAGEGWHNNHHAYQLMANYGHQWWEFDLTYQTIRLLERLGLVWNVVHDVPRRPLPNIAAPPTVRP